MADSDKTTGTPVGSVDVLTRDEVSLDKGWNTVLYNDPVNSLGFVIDTLMKIGLTEEEATAKTWEAHNLGQTIVFHGTLDEAQLKAEQLLSAHLTAEAVAA